MSIDGRSFTHNIRHKTIFKAGKASLKSTYDYHRLQRVKQTQFERRSLRTSLGCHPRQSPIANLMCKRINLTVSIVSASLPICILHAGQFPRQIPTENIFTQSRYQPHPLQSLAYIASVELRNRHSHCVCTIRKL